MSKKWGEFESDSANVPNESHLFKWCKYNKESNEEFLEHHQKKMLALSGDDISMFQSSVIRDDSLQMKPPSHSIVLNISEVQPYKHMIELHEYIRYLDGLMEKIQKKKSSEGDSDLFSYHQYRNITNAIDEPPEMNTEVSTNLEKVTLVLLTKDVTREILKRSVSCILCCLGFSGCLLVVGIPNTNFIVFFLCYHSDCNTEVLAVMVDLLERWFHNTSRDLASIFSQTCSNQNVLTAMDALGGLPPLSEYYTQYVPNLHLKLVERAENNYEQTIKLAISDSLST